MRPDPSFEIYSERWLANYDKANYGNSLAGRLLKRSHAILERKFANTDRFAQVLEIGAGTGIHLNYVRHRFDRYVMTDEAEQNLRAASERTPSRSANITFQQENARALSFADQTFDRLIATFVLEHLAEPHAVLREWARVIRPGGLMSIMLPCDPGLTWRIGRYLGPRAAAMGAGIEYDYWMSREHVNSIYNLVSLMRYYFDEIDEIWYPTHVPLADVNLVYLCHVTI